MFFTRYLFSLLILIGYVTINTNQNELPPLTNNYKQRIKRLLFHKSSKARLKNKPRYNLLDEDLLFEANSDDNNQSESETRKGYTQQEVAEIQRILSKNEDDYYGILNIKRKQETPQKIYNAYRKLVLRVHPDKFNAPNAKEATQKLNKAYKQLMSKYEYQNQDTFPSNNDQDERASNDNSKSSSYMNDRKSLVLTTLSSKKIKMFKSNASNKNTIYLVLAFIILIIGIIIFIIYWKKRRGHSSSSISKKAKIASKYDSPVLNDDDAISIDGTSETSIAQDDE